ncbi:MAG: hypothetical protein VXW58_01690 [Pseudomonadota bacterium]|nr:hypothetical protein [Pseudomonadota bacterium]
MTRRKRVPLQLKGSDEQYFRTREIAATPPAEAAPEPAADPAPQTIPQQEASAAVEPMPSVSTPKPIAEPVSSRPAAPEPTPVQNPEAEGEGEVISRIVPLGRPLSIRVQALAEEVGVSVDDLLYAARKGAVQRLRTRLAAPERPELPATIKGGETIRISFKLSATELARLAAWYDPLGLGLATKAVAPLLAQALRDEVAQICAPAG